MPLLFISSSVCSFRKEIGEFKSGKPLNLAFGYVLVELHPIIVNGVIESLQPHETYPKQR